MKSLNLGQVIKEPTRITKTSETLIDHIYVNAPNLTSYQAGIFTQPISDHLASYLIVYSKGHVSLKERPFTRIMSEKNINLFTRDIVILTNSLDFKDDKNANDMWSAFTQNVTASYEKCFPLVKVSRKKFKDKEWITQDIKKSCKEKERLYKKFMKTKSSVDENNYKNYKNNLNKIIKSAKSKYMSNLISDDPSNKKLWSEMNKLTRTAKSYHDPIKLKVGSDTISNPSDVCELFNQYFSEIGPNLASKVHTTATNNFQKFMSDKLDKSISLNLATPTEIKNIINGMRNKSSSGHDLISPKLLKQAVNELAPTLSKLINMSILEREYPDCLKIAKIIPVYKKGSKADTANYRPISLLPTFNKIFERVLHKQLTVFIESNEILFNRQYGFRKYHSTIDALISSIDYIIESLNNKLKVLGVFIDLQKAFDSIDINILCQKLKYYGIDGNFHKLICSYLTNRKIFTVVDKSESKLLPITYGVPQGSVLGPLLYLLFINDIKTLADKMELRLFADDTNMFVTSTNYKELEEKSNEALSICNDWMTCNKLTINITKTHYLLFSKGTALPDQPKLNIKIGDRLIKKENCTKYLGLTIQSNLKWDLHAINIIKGLNKFINLFYRIRSYLTKKQKDIIYKALVFSKYNYGIEIYGNCSQKWLNQIQITQNRLLKILYDCNPMFNTNLLHKNANILKISDNYKLRLLLQIYRLLFNPELAPVEFKDIVTTNSSVHCYNTRKSKNIHLTCMAYLKHAKVIDRASIEWNSLPRILKEIKSRSKFKEGVFRHFINFY